MPTSPVLPPNQGGDRHHLPPSVLLALALLLPLAPFLHEVVYLRLLVSFRVEVGSVIILLHWLLLIFFLLFRRHGFFVFMHRAFFMLGVARA